MAEQVKNKLKDWIGHNLDLLTAYNTLQRLMLILYSLILRELGISHDLGRAGQVQA